MKRKFIMISIIITILTGNLFATETENRQVLNVLDFGAIPNDNLNDADALRAAVKAAKDQHAGTLVFPSGRYILEDAKAVKLQNEGLVCNGDKPPQSLLFKPGFDYVIGLDFSGAQDLTVEAAGVELICNGWMEPVSLNKSKNITINGLTIDYMRVPNSAGKVIKVGLGYADVVFDDQYPVTAQTKYLRIMLYDQEKKSLMGRATYQTSDRLIAPQTIRFYGLGLSKKHLGKILIAWHCFHFRPAILIQQSENTVLNDVTIFAQPGMGIVGHMSTNLTFNRLKVIPREGRYVSSNTDATHFVSCRGFIHFDSCEFGGQGDDSTNVHTFYLDIIQKESAGSIFAELNRRFETHSLFPELPFIGDTMAIVDRDTMEEKSYVKVTGVDQIAGERKIRIKFDGEMPDNISKYLIVNVTACPELKFQNCKVRSHRARSVLVKTRKVLIENCDIENTTGTAIHLGVEGNWMEGISSSDVIIRNNKISNCGLGGDWDGTIDNASAIAIHVNSNNQNIPGIHKRILIENNQITGGISAISVRGAEDVTIRNNTFIDILQKAIKIASSRRVKVYDNTGAPSVSTDDQEPALPIMN